MLIKTLALNTYREAIRNRVLYGIAFFSLFIIVLSNALAGLSFNERERILIHFGLGAVQFSLIVLTIFLGNALIAKEIEKKTILSILSKPVSREKFLLGKYLGLGLVLLVLFLAFSLLFLSILHLNSVDITRDLLIAFWGIFIESQVLLAVCVFLGTFTTPFFNASFSIGVFCIGHWQESLAFFAGKSENFFLSLVNRIVKYLFPNLDIWNWKKFATSTHSLSIHDFLLSHLHAIGWVGILLFFASLFFRRKNCG